MSKAIRPLEPETDIALIGAGIMSATLGIMLKELNPDFTIQIFERLDRAGLESSDAWNNAGTGHSAFCELNYTPQKSGGAVDISKALKICESYELSKEFWSHLVENNFLSDPAKFISRVPHMSFVWGEENVSFLNSRYNLLKETDLFSEMKFSSDRGEIEKWVPLIMEERNGKDAVAATRMEIGTDVNFGELTRNIIRHLEKMPGVTVHYNIETLDIDPHKKGGWEIITRNLLNDVKKSCRASKFVFLGAGGATLNLLKKAEIDERKGYGGFPVSGLWLKCNNEKLIEKHFAKVYGKASVGSPPMSVPHIDTRMINGKKELLFGPFAGFSTKFLKSGSRLDLAKSIKYDNILPMISAGLHNLPLTRYLIDQLKLSHEDRMAALRQYVPQAKSDEWELKEAGQRVQVIKKDHGMHGVLEFGTEAVVSADGSVAALLGASPGASTAAAIMFGILPRCFKNECKSAAWQNKMKAMAPSFGRSLATDKNALAASRQRTSKILNL
ncbi:MAG: Malate:quinone oxidoreductase [Cytophagales bacterium]|jgi:malate dehydrogenase (quinone)|nr:malate dehydrogenase (quinone) [Bacteroidota bacterium]MBS1979961.1 malate dehydrogenase (quinone) [Bacteroidota bacterium]WHZ07293.1 MAG: Malate:quinone oxidoreductase [Cytophagales bacterium]